MIAIKTCSKLCQWIMQLLNQQIFKKTNKSNKWTNKINFKLRIRAINLYNKNKYNNKYSHNQFRIQYNNNPKIPMRVKLIITILKNFL